MKPSNKNDTFDLRLKFYCICVIRNDIYAHLSIRIDLHWFCLTFFHTKHLKCSSHDKLFSNTRNYDKIDRLQISMKFYLFFSSNKIMSKWFFVYFFLMFYRIVWVELHLYTHIIFVVVCNWLFVLSKQDVFNTFIFMDKKKQKQKKTIRSVYILKHLFHYIDFYSHCYVLFLVFLFYLYYFVIVFAASIFTR